MRQSRQKLWKTTTAIIATSAMLAGGVLLTGCSSSSSSDDQSSSIREASESSSSESEETTADSDFTVTVDDCTVTEDYEGNPAIVVTYTWTNNSDDTAAFYTTFTVDAYQNGVELDSAYFLANDDEFDLNASSNKIKSGATQTVQVAYKLSDETTDVEIEVTEWLSFDDTVLAEATFAIS